MRHLAWLHAVPEPKGKGKNQDRRTRAQRFAANEEDGTERPELIPPDIPSEAGYLVEHLMAIGPASAGEVVTFHEIQAWSALTGNVLTSWEASTLRALSLAYLSEYHAATDPDRPMPGGEIRKEKPSRAEISQRISDMFARLEEQDRKKGIAPKG